MDREYSISMDEVAKGLNIHGFGRNSLYKFLREQRVLNHRNVPFQHYMDQGYFVLITQKFYIGDVKHAKFKTTVTAKGVEFIHKLVKDNYESVTQGIPAECEKTAQVELPGFEH